MGNDIAQASIRSSIAARFAAFKALPGLKVAFGDQLIRVYGNAAVNTGYYTFSYDGFGVVERYVRRSRCSQKH